MPPGLLEIARTNPAHLMHRTTVKHGFPVVIFYMPATNKLHNFFIVTMEGRRCDSWLELSEAEVENLNKEIFGDEWFKRAISACSTST